MKTINYADVKPGQHWLTVQQLGSGWAAVEMWLNNEHEDHPEDFPEPYETGFGRYATRREAVEEALGWAEAEDLPIQEGHER